MQLLSVINLALLVCIGEV
jgi:hypothetical protein